jgi:hypothetical protein
MPRQIKLLGLLVLAIAATSAVGASAAQAGQFTAAAYPATITGQNVGGAHVFTTEVGMMNCNVTFHGELGAASEELTLTPTYNCGIAGLEVDVDLNGCDYVLHAGETLVMHKVAGSMDIVCPEGAVIDFEITSMVVCNLTVGEQLGLEAITYTNRTMAADVDADMSLGEIEYELDAGCPVMGGFVNGTYGGTTTLKSDNEGSDGFIVD